MKTCLFPLSVLRAREVLNGAESTFVQQSCNNAQVSADRAVKFPHAESFSSGTSNSLIEVKRNQSAASRPFSRLQGEISEIGQYLATITDKGYSPLLRPSLNEYLPDLHVCSAKGRPSPGPVQPLPMFGFSMPNEKEPDMSQQPPSQFLLSG